MLEFNITLKMFDLVVDIIESIGALSNFNKGLDNFPRLKKEMLIKSVCAMLNLDDIKVSEEQVSKIMLGKRVYLKEDLIQAVKNTIKAYQDLEKIDYRNIEDAFRVNELLIERSEKINIPIKETYISFDFVKQTSLNPLILAVVMMVEIEDYYKLCKTTMRIAMIWLKVVIMSYKPIFRYVPIESALLKNEYVTTKFASYEERIEFVLDCILQAVKSFTIKTEEHRHHISYQVQKLLKVMEYYPQTIQEIMKKMHLSSRSGFRKNYLNPAIELGLISMTIPDKPTSKNQMYYKV